MNLNFDDIRDTGLSINEFLTLLTVYLKQSNKEEVDYEPSFDDYINLQKKGMVKILYEESGETVLSIRGLGKSVIEKIMDFTSIKSSKNSTIDVLFKEWWDLFPTTDQHSIYPKSRALKSNRKGCRKKYEDLIKEGVKHHDIIKALRYEIEERKKTSGKDNKLSYMKNSNTWINQREFEIILESMETSNEADDWTSNMV